MSHLKWVYKYQYLQEEFKDIKEQEKSNIKEFNDYFSLEDTNEEEPNKLPPVVEDLLPNKDSNNPGKGLYKELSKKLHPDVGGDTEEFSSISVAYRNKDTISLFLKAEEYEIDTEKYLDEELINSFETSCELIQNKIKTVKGTISWLWCNAESELDKKRQLDYLKKEFNLIPKSP